MRKYLAAATVTVIGISNSAFAIAAEDEPAVGLQEIIVTATRREESISKVPISIEAFDRDALQAKGITSIQDLAATTAGIEFDTTGGFSPNTGTNIAVRGINSSTGTSTTGIYLDDTPIQTRQVNLSYFGNPYPLIFDVERVEVDRGPQGTLFGAGAEGGAIRFINTSPSLKETSGFMRAGFSTTEGGAPSEELGAAVGGPIIQDKLGYRVSAWVQRDGGYVDRVDPLTGATVAPNSNSEFNYIIRGAITYAATDWLTITPSLFLQSTQAQDSASVFEYLSNPSEGRLINGQLLAEPSHDHFYLPSLKVEAKLEDFTITSISSYFRRFGNLVSDGTSYYGFVFGGYGDPRGFSYPTAYDDAAAWYLHTKVNIITQELRASSNDPNARFRWTGGVFFSSALQTDSESAPGPFQAVNFFDLPPETPLFYSQITSKDRQVAAFGQVDWRIVAALTATAGLRVSHVRNEFLQYQAGIFSVPELAATQGHAGETPVIPKFGLSYQINDNHMVYASAAKGYRVGGANQPIPLASSGAEGGCDLPNQPPPFNSDSTWSYELGTKDRAFGGRFRLDASVFYVNWKGVQQNVNFSNCSFGFIANAGSAVSKGFDFTLQVMPLDSLILTVSAAYTDAYFNQTVTLGGTPIAADGEAVGAVPQVVAPWNVVTSAEYTFKVGSQPLNIRVEDSYKSHNPGPFSNQIVGTATYDPASPANPSTNLLNLRATLPFNAFSVAVYANNALNRLPYLSRFHYGLGETLFTDTTFRPRTIGVEVTYKF